MVTKTGFLRSPAPNIAVNRIDFSGTDLPEYTDRYAVILDNVLTARECELLLQAAEFSTEQRWDRAMINIGGGEQMLVVDSRNCGRIIWDSQDIADRVWNRIAHVPEVQEILRLQDMPHVVGNGPGKRGEVWKFSRLNERMRFLKYENREYFRPHCDGAYETPDGKERSYFTLHLYLNNAGLLTPQEMASMTPKQRSEAYKNVLVGGATTFHGYDMLRKFDVLPKAGRVLLFQHRDLIHSGDDVDQGVKYTMRTDLMYSLESAESEQKNKVPVLEDEPVSSDEEGTDGFAESQQYLV